MALTAPPRVANAKVSERRPRKKLKRASNAAAEHIADLPEPDSAGSAQVSLPSQQHRFSIRNGLSTSYVTPSAPASAIEDPDTEELHQWRDVSPEKGRLITRRRSYGYTRGSLPPSLSSPTKLPQPDSEPAVLTTGSSSTSRSPSLTVTPPDPSPQHVELSPSESDVDAEFCSKAEFKSLQDVFLTSLSVEGGGRAKAMISRDMHRQIRAVLEESLGPDTTTSHFRQWVKKKFSLRKTGQGQYDHELITLEGKRVAVMEDLYHIVVACHREAGHGSSYYTFDVISAKYSYVPRKLVSSFIEICRTCNSPSPTPPPSTMSPPPPALAPLYSPPGFDISEAPMHEYKGIRYTNNGTFNCENLADWPSQPAYATKQSTDIYGHPLTVERPFFDTDNWITNSAREQHGYISFPFSNATAPSQTAIPLFNSHQMEFVPYDPMEKRAVRVTKEPIVWYRDPAPRMYTDHECASIEASLTDLIVQLGESEMSRCPLPTTIPASSYTSSPALHTSHFTTPEYSSQSFTPTLPPNDGPSALIQTSLKPRPEFLFPTYSARRTQNRANETYLCQQAPPLPTDNTRDPQHPEAQAPRANRRSRAAGLSLDLSRSTFTAWEQYKPVDPSPITPLFTPLTANSAGTATSSSSPSDMVFGLSVMSRDGSMGANAPYEGAGGMSMSSCEGDEFGGMSGMWFLRSPVAGGQLSPDDLLGMNY